MPLSNDDFLDAANILQVDPAAIYSVASVESAGEGFLKSGRPKILFEAHIFWKELEKIGINPREKVLYYSEILSPKWDRSLYKGGESEHGRLLEAFSIDKRAALRSASWGAFQIMGFNHKSCGFDDVFEFVECVSKSDKNQLITFCEFIKFNRLDSYIRRLDWAGFAKRYNGAGYKANRYDEKMARAYSEYMRKS